MDRQSAFSDYFQPNSSAWHDRVEIRLPDKEEDVWEDRECDKLPDDRARELADRQRKSRFNHRYNRDSGR